ncbi:MAG TPA: aspartate kinase, partial [Syntrophales bacterium]|nr:aspartate kinase [Syntrophales bacterium]
MALVVQKYGGTSVADIERIENVARKVIKAREAKNDLVVVVSAMAGETDRLIRLAHSAAPDPIEREYDVLIASGEQVSVALLSIVLNRMGCKAKSYLAYQVKIITDGDFTRARILKIDRSLIQEDLRQGYVAVVAGFQGIDRKNNVTTLGRGGSDTSAVALAAALGADVCEIYTDVDGVYTADPNICDNARLLKKICYEEMLELASAGAKVLHP